MYVIRRLTALLLALVLALSLFSGCSFSKQDKGSDKEDTKGTHKSSGKKEEDTEDRISPEENERIWHFSAELEEAVLHSLIFAVGKSNCFVNGCKESRTFPAPQSSDNGTPLIPASFAAGVLGFVTAFSNDGALLTIQTEAGELILKAGEAALSKAGQTVALQAEIRSAEGDLLADAEGLAEALGVQAVCREDGLILLGDGIQNALSDYDESESPEGQLFFGGIRSDLATPTGGAVSGRDYASPFPQGENDSDFYYNQCERASVLRLSPEEIPYHTPSDELFGRAGNIYIENISVEEFGEDEYMVSFTVYNLSSGYGVVQVYDENDTICDNQTYSIPRHEGQSLSVIGAFEDAYELVKAGFGGNFVEDVAIRSYLNSATAAYTVFVPIGGYVVITGNPSKSEALALYDAINLVVETYLTTEAFAGLDGDEAISVGGILKDELISMAQSDPDLRSELLGCLNNLIASLAGGEEFIINTEFAKAMSAGCISYLTENAPDICDMFAEKAGELMKSGVDTALKELLNFISGGAMEAGDKIFATTNFISLLIDMKQSLNAGSFIIEVENYIVTMDIKSAGSETKGTITARKKDGTVVWTQNTSSPFTQISSQYSIGQYRNRFFYAIKGEVVCLRASDGKELWRTTGASMYMNVSPNRRYSYIAKDGRIFLTATMGDALLVLSPQGEILCHSKDLDCNEVPGYGFLAVYMEVLDDGMIHIVGTGSTGMDASQPQYDVLLNPDTYEYSHTVSFPYA